MQRGVVVDESSRRSATVEGKVGVYWQGMHYSVSLRDLPTNAEAVRECGGQTVNRDVETDYRRGSGNFSSLP